MTVISSSSRSLPTEFDARLVEEAVLLRLQDDPLEHRFRRDRDRIYEIADSQERERKFCELHASWFASLRLDRTVRATLAEQPLLLLEARRCSIVPAVSAQDEGSDLYGASGSLSAGG